MDSAEKPQRHRPLASIAENVCEAGAACLVTMVQGNLLAVTLTHWAIASRTGLFAGLAAAFLVWLTRSNRPWVWATLLGLVTAVVDALMHPGGFGPGFAEAIVTGAGAATLSLVVARVALRLRRRRSEG